MSYVENEHPNNDALGRKTYKGDRVVFCYRGWDGKRADLQPGTVMRVTDYGFWIKPDNPRYARNLSRWDWKTKKYVKPVNAPTDGWKWSSCKMVIKLAAE